MVESFDLIIIGGGPAGLAAGVYGGRAKLKTLLLEKASIGGRSYTTREIVNYPGVESTSGPELAAAMSTHAKDFGVDIRQEAVKSVLLSGPVKRITTRRHEYEAKAVILATGTAARTLNIPGERELTGLGVAYCATCDAEFFRDQTVVVVGSGDQGIEEGMYIAKFARRVIVVVLHEEGVLDCNKQAAAQAFAHPKLEFIWNSVLDEIYGQESVTGVRIKNVKTGALSDVPCQGVFFFVGTTPVTGMFQGQVELDPQGWILTNERMETSCPGVYAAGDVRSKYLRQVCTSVSDGAVAATAAERYIEEVDSFNRIVQSSKEPVLLAFWDPNQEGSVERLALMTKLDRQNGGPCQVLELDVTRKKYLSLNYNVHLSAACPAAAWLLQSGRPPQQLEFDRPLTAQIRTYKADNADGLTPVKEDNEVPHLLDR